MALTNPTNVLALFNEKVDRITSLSFFPKAKGSGAIVEFRHDAGWKSMFVGPDEESFEALVLILRLFIQNNDSISLQKVRALYVSSSYLDELS